MSAEIKPFDYPIGYYFFDVVNSDDYSSVKELAVMLFLCNRYDKQGVWSWDKKTLIADFCTAFRHSPSSVSRWVDGLRFNDQEFVLVTKTEVVLNVPLFHNKIAKYLSGN